MGFTKKCQFSETRAKLLKKDLRPSIAFHIEISPNQINGFLMKRNSGLKYLIYPYSCDID